MESRNDEFWPLSGKPYHGFLLSKSQVLPSCNMALPTKLHSLLPSIVMPAILYCGGKKWTMEYYGNRRTKSLDSKNWRIFVSKNGLKVGDGCVFELIDCSCNLIKFGVQILRCDIPSQLHDKFSGESEALPILID